MRILLESVCTLWTTVSGGRFGWVFVWQLTIDNVWPGHGTRSTPGVAPMHQAPEHCAVPGHQHQIRLNHMSSNGHRLGHHRHTWCCTSAHTRTLLPRHQVKTNQRIFNGDNLSLIRSHHHQPGAAPEHYYQDTRSS